MMGLLRVGGAAMSAALMLRLLPRIFPRGAHAPLSRNISSSAAEVPPHTPSHLHPSSPPPTLATTSPTLER